MENMCSVTEANSNKIICETDWIQFRNSLIHSRGGFARKNIPSGARIIEYVGERIPKGESLKRCEAGNEYIFTIDDDCDLDGNVDWNPARLINHSCAPNCEAEWDEGRIFINALRDINAGEELTFNYNYDLEDYKAHPCRCGAPQCVGYIVAEEFFDRVRRAVGLQNSCTPVIVNGNSPA